MNECQSENSECCRDFPVSSNRADKVALQLKALAHPVRLHILQHLGRHNRQCCNDFCQNIPLAQSTISQHLKILNEADLIEYLPEGNYSHYSLKLNHFSEVIQSLLDIKNFASQSQPAKTLKPEMDNT